MHGHWARRRVVLAGSAAVVSLPHVGWSQALTRTVVELGVVPHLSPRTLLGIYRPLREWLQLRLHRDVQLSTAPGWAAFHRRTVDAAYDTVLTAANLARVAQLDAGWRPLVTFRPPIRALLVGPRQRAMPIGAEWRGARIALANAMSLVTQRGLRWLAEQGLRPGIDVHTVEATHDDGVAARVLRGECAAGLLSGGELRALPDAQRQGIDVWHTLGEVPGFVALASPQLGPGDRVALARAWETLDGGADEARAVFAATGLGGVDMADEARMAAADPYVAETRRQLAAGAAAS